MLVLEHVEQRDELGGAVVGVVAGVGRFAVALTQELPQRVDRLDEAVRRLRAVACQEGAEQPGACADVDELERTVARADSCVRRASAIDARRTAASAQFDGEGALRALRSYRSSKPASEIPRECEKTAKRTTEFPTALSESTSIPSRVRVVQPGIEAEVNTLVPTTASESRTPIPKIAVNAVIARMAMRSVNGVSIRTPCIRSRNRFMRDWPAYRVAARERNRRDRNVEADQRRRVAEVEVGMQQHPPRQPSPVRGVVAVPNGHARQDPEQDSEEEVHHSEAKRLAAFGAASDAQALAVVGSLEQRIEQAGQILGPVFAVGVHRDDEVGVVDVGLDDAETEHDRTLMAQVERRRDDRDIVVARRGLGLGVEAAGVVDEDEADRSSAVRAATPRSTSRMRARSIVNASTSV